MQHHKYRVEYFDKKVNDFVIYSRHKNQEFAEINAKVLNLLRKCDTRVIHKGVVVVFLDVGKNK